MKFRFVVALSVMTLFIIVVVAYGSWIKQTDALREVVFARATEDMGPYAAAADGAWQDVDGAGMQPASLPSPSALEPLSANVSEWSKEDLVQLLERAQKAQPYPLCQPLEEWTPEMLRWLEFFETTMVPLREQVLTVGTEPTDPYSASPGAAYFLTSAQIGLAKGETVRVVEALHDLKEMRRREAERDEVWPPTYEELLRTQHVLYGILCLEDSSQDLWEQALNAVMDTQKTISFPAHFAGLRRLVVATTEEWRQRGLVESVEEAGVVTGVRSWLWAGPVCRPFFNKDAIKLVQLLERLEEISSESFWDNRESFDQLEQEINSLSVLYYRTQWLVYEIASYKQFYEWTAFFKMTNIEYQALRYKQAHGNLPASLKDMGLSADGLSDPVSGKDFSYRPSADAEEEYVLEGEGSTFKIRSPPPCPCFGTNRNYVFNSPLDKRP